MTDIDAHVMAPAPVSDAGDRSTPLWIAAVIGCVVLISAPAFIFFQGETAGAFVWALMAAFAVAGLMALVVVGIGLVDLRLRSRRGDLATSLLANMPDGVLLTDSAGRVVLPNKAYLAMTDADNERDARPIHLAFGGEPLMAEAVYRLNMAVKQGRSAVEEVRVTSRGGTKTAPTWLRINAQPFADGARKRLVLWTMSDVTRQREKQENIVEELQQAIDYLDHAPAGFLSIEGDGTIGYINATLANQLGIDLGEAAAGTLRVSDIVSGQQASMMIAPAARPGEVRSDILDIDFLGRDGRSRPSRVYHHVSYSADGTPGASRTLVVDRSASSVVDIDEGLRLAEIRFARFFNTAPMAIASIDAQGRVVRFNAAFGRLLDNQASKGSRLVEAVGDADRPGFDNALGLAKAGQGIIPPVDLKLATRDERWVRFYMAAVDEVDKEGETALVFGVETTEQRKLQAQFAQSEKMNAIGNLAASIAHDFNNLLTVIILSCEEVLNEHLVPSDPAFQNIIKIKQNANRAAALVSQLLAFARQQDRQLKILDLRQTLPDARALLGRSLGEQVSLDLNTARGLWFVKADRQQFDQIVMNLSVNARDAMPGGGRLTIRALNVEAAQVDSYGFPAMSMRDYVLIEFGDTGSGIPQEIVDRIFEPFFTTKEMGKGTGLGLSTVYGIVKQMDGYIFVTSAPGKGTTFHIFLPRYVPSEKELSPKAEVREKKVPDLTGNGTILVVEDEEDVRKHVAHALGKRGYSILQAGDGAAALDVMRARGADVHLVLTDVKMPVMDGPSMVHELRRDWPDVKIIFMSGFADGAFEREFKDDAVTFLPKPFELKALAQAVKDKLAS